jgi:hypothetical protein
MFKIAVQMPSDEEFAQAMLDAIKAHVEPVLQSVADMAPAVIKDQAMLENEDVDGQQMPQKKPRPKRSPQNFPNLPLIQNEDPDEMNNSRWSNEKTADFEVTVTYQPSDHHGYLAEKGRDWLNADAMNPNARAKLEQALREGME